LPHGMKVIPIEGIFKKTTNAKDKIDLQRFYEKKRHRLR